MKHRLPLIIALCLLVAWPGAGAAQSLPLQNPVFTLTTSQIQLLREKIEERLRQKGLFPLLPSAPVDQSNTMPTQAEQPLPSRPTPAPTHGAAPAASNIPKQLNEVQQVLRLVNTERRARDLHPLHSNRLLTQAADAHARDMRLRDYFNHVTPEGRTVEDRIRQAGYLDVDVYSCKCTGWHYSVGENIARGTFTPESIVSAWMNSPTHRDNILSPGFTEMGLARVGNVWVQTFGSLTLHELIPFPQH